MATRLNNIQKVMTTLSIDTELHHLLIYQGNDSLRKLIQTENDTYQSLVDNAQIKFFAVDIDQIFIFEQWHHIIYSKIFTFTDSNIIFKRTDEEWYIFCNE